MTTEPVAVLDHLVLAAGPEGLDDALDAIAARLDRRGTPGGVHPLFGTRNAVLPLADGAYLEVVEVADQAVARSSPFGQAIAAGQAAGGGWVGWAARVSSYDALADAAARSGLALADGERARPDGVTLRWRMAGLERLADDPALPYLIAWDVVEEDHPSHANPGSPRPPRVVEMRLAGDASALRARLGGELAGIRLDWVSGAPAGVRAVDLEVDGRPVTL